VVVGVVTWELHLSGCQSLKAKRQILTSLKDRLHRRFNVSVAETDYQDVWRRAELSCCVVSGTRKHAEQVLGAADSLVASDPLARIIDSAKSFL
jgi:uncharacterized protein YlxP (DUF503 family)